MTIEQLLELNGEDLEKLSQDSTRLQQELGWCLSITRPDLTRKPSANMNLSKRAEEAKIEAGRELANKMLAEMGKNIKL